MKILRPLFNLLARPGIIGPHAGYEAELLLAGSKPVGAFWPRYPHGENIPDLDKAVSEGRLLKMSFTRQIDEKFHIYALPENIELATTNHRLWLKGVYQDLSPEELAEKDEAREKISARLKPVPAPSLLANIFSAAAEVLGFSTTQKRDDSYLKAARQLPAAQTAYVSLSNVDVEYKTLPMTVAALEKLEKNGLIARRDEIAKCDESFIIYGKPGQEQNMKDMGYLLQHYNEENGDKFDACWEGKTLGFTDNDVDLWCGGRQKMGAVQSFFMAHTNGLRRWCRTQASLMDAADEAKNPKPVTASKPRSPA